MRTQLFAPNHAIFSVLLFLQAGSFVVSGVVPSPWTIGSRPAEYSPAPMLTLFKKYRNRRSDRGTLREVYHILEIAMARRLKTVQNNPTKAEATVDVSKIVTGVLENVQTRGDAAIRQYSERFDSWSPQSFKLSQEEIDSIVKSVPDQLIKDIKEVQGNVRKFAEAQKASLKEFELEIQPGVFLGQKNNPINRVGWFVPLKTFY